MKEIKRNCDNCSDFDCNKNDDWCLKNKFSRWKSKEYGNKLKSFYKKANLLLICSVFNGWVAQKSVPWPTEVVGWQNPTPAH